MVPRLNAWGPKKPGFLCRSGTGSRRRSEDPPGAAASSHRGSERLVPWNRETRRWTGWVGWGMINIHNFLWVCRKPQLSHWTYLDVFSRSFQVHGREQPYYYEWLDDIWWSQTSRCQIPSASWAEKVDLRIRYPQIQWIKVKNIIFLKLHEQFLGTGHPPMFRNSSIWMSYLLYVWSFILQQSHMAVLNIPCKLRHSFVKIN